MPAAWTPSAAYLDRSRLCAVAVLAIGAIGAVFIPIFSGYGAEAIAGRLRDAEAKVLVCADGFYRRGQVVKMKEVADEAADGAPSVGTVVVVDRVGRAYPKRGRDVAWSDVTHVGAVLDFADTSAEDPFMVIYTTGTTGKPKGAQHVHGGFPVKAAQDLAHCFDLQERDVILWSTDIGWMMGPWLIAGGLMLGATIVLYDGTPDFPDASRMWSLVERHRVTHLGISPTAIRGLMRSGEDAVRAKDRSSLFVLGSTGEPWNPDPWWWYFRNVGDSRCPIVNYSGGTEISGGIVGCTTWTPIQPGSFIGPCPGMDADVVDDRGRSVRGAVGELVIRKPWPGMTRGFWRDPPTEEGRYFQTYWSRLPNTLVHGDLSALEHPSAIDELRALTRAWIHRERPHQGGRSPTRYGLSPPRFAVIARTSATIRAAMRKKNATARSAARSSAGGPDGSGKMPWNGRTSGSVIR